MVSALLNPRGAPARVLDLFLGQALTLLYDDRLLAEYRRVLSRPRFSFGNVEIGALLELIAAEGELVVAPPVALLLPDPSELPFAEVALAGRAELLISGNARHFRPSRGELGVRVVDPATFLGLWSARD